MKKMMMVAALLAAVVAAGQAWAGAGCGACPMGAKKKSAEKSCSSYLSGIELTADQQAKIAQIEDECKAQGSTPEACKASKSAIREVLNDDQRAAFDAACSKEGKKGGCGS